MRNYLIHPDYSFCTVAPCARKHYLTPTAFPVPAGACGDAFPHSLDGYVAACALPAGHDGDHVESADEFGSVRAWAAREA